MKIVVALLLSFSFAQARVELSASCHSSTKTGDSEGIVGYGTSILDSEGKNVHLFQDFNLDKAFYMLSLAKTGELQGGGETFRLSLVRVEDDQEIHFSKRPKVKGRISSSANVQENGGTITTTWLDPKAKKGSIDKIKNTFPIKLNLDYQVKTGFFKNQKIQVSCEVKVVNAPSEFACLGEAQILSGEIVSTQYIEGIGCKAEVTKLVDVKSNLTCRNIVFDVDLERFGIVVEPPSARGCTAKAGDKITGVAEMHGELFYMFNPQN